MAIDLKEIMTLAVRLAEKGRGFVSPNPVVGAVVVKDDKIIATGYHKKFGCEHAEIVAFKKIKDKKLLEGAKLFVTLEPCAHYGKTPPCVSEIIKSGIKEVYVGIKDPNPLVAGKGIKALKASGIKVHIGFLKDVITRQNEAYLKFITKRLPFVTVKVGLTLDGKIATKDGEAKWITDKEMRRHANRLRCYHDGVLCGINTIIKDDPLLTCREIKNKRVKRIILDPNLRIPLSAKILHTPGDVLIFYNKENSTKIEQLKKMGVELIKMANPSLLFNWKIILKELAKRNIASLLIEGGEKTISSAFEAGVVDKVYLYYAPKILGAGISITDSLVRNLKNMIELKDWTITKVSKGFIFCGYVHGNN